MLVEAISIILFQLNQYIHQSDGNPPGTADPAIWGNISQNDSPPASTALENQLVLTLVNIEEEKALKNAKTTTLDPSGAVQYHNPPLNLNLLLVISANYTNYETALKRLAQVLNFFQGKKRFTSANSPDPSLSASSMGELSLTMDLLSLSFEETNHLWASLGGKQLPFAAYRGRLVTMLDRRILEGGGRIEEIEVIGRGDI